MTDPALSPAQRSALIDAANKGGAHSFPHVAGGVSQPAFPGTVQLHWSVAKVLIRHGYLRRRRDVRLAAGEIESVAEWLVTKSGKSRARREAKDS